MANEMRDRIARVLEECHTKRGFFHRGVASWEYDWLLTWRDREPLSLSAQEDVLLQGIERIVLGPVR
jgi:hypothetical protein